MYRSCVAFAQQRIGRSRRFSVVNFLFSLRRDSIRRRFLFFFRFSILFRVVGPSIANIAVVRPATETVVPRARVMVYEDANTRSISINHE